MRGARLNTTGVSAPAIVPDHCREQAQWCRDLGSPLTADLCLAFAEDFEAGGVIHHLTRDWPGNPRKDALALRLTGFLHYSVLNGTAPELAAEYPPQQTGWSMERIWPLARKLLQTETEAAARFIQGPPQTNETRRCIALLPGFLELANQFDMPMHLLELGASAGLNQNWDRYGYETDSWSRPGSSDVVIRSDWRAPAPPLGGREPVIMSRAACDISPIDVTVAEQALRLKSYVWPDQAERLERLDAAISLARDTGINLEKADAAEWLAAKLSARPSQGLTVVFHSVFLIYPPRETIAAIMSMIAAAGAAATAEAPIAWLCYESEALFGGNRTSPMMMTRLQTWPGGQERVLNRSDGHVTKVVAA